MVQGEWLMGLRFLEMRRVLWRLVVAVEVLVVVAVGALESLLAVTVAHVCWGSAAGGGEGVRGEVWLRLQEVVGQLRWPVEVGGRGLNDRDDPQKK